MVGGVRLQAAVARLVSAAGFAALWVVFAGAELGYAPLVAIAVVAAALGASARLGGPRRWRWRPLVALRFAGYFLRVSIVGGFDVARRALSRRPAIEPGIDAFDLTLDDDTPAPAVFVGVVSLVPGTLCAELRGRQLLVHVIDRRRDHRRRLRELEARLAPVFVAPGARST